MVWQQQLSVVTQQPRCLAPFLPCLSFNAGRIRMPLCNYRNDGIERADSSTDTGGRRFWRETGTSTSIRSWLQVARTDQLGHGTSVFRGGCSLHPTHSRTRSPPTTLPRPPPHTIVTAYQVYRYTYDSRIISFLYRSGEGRVVLAKSPINDLTKGLGYEIEGGSWRSRVCRFCF